MSSQIYVAVYVSHKSMWNVFISYSSIHIFHILPNTDYFEQGFTEEIFIVPLFAAMAMVTVIDECDDISRDRICVNQCFIKMTLIFVLKYYRVERERSGPS